MKKGKRELKRKKSLLPLYVCIILTGIGAGLILGLNTRNSGALNGFLSLDAKATNRDDLIQGAEDQNSAERTDVEPEATESIAPIATPEPTEPPELPRTVVMLGLTKGIITPDGEEYFDTAAGYVYATEPLDVYDNSEFAGEPLYRLDANETAIVLETRYFSPISGDELKELLSGGDTFIKSTKGIAASYYVIAGDTKGYIDATKTEVLDELFVLVDISDQHLWLIDRDTVLLDTDVVTGCIARKNPTRLGKFTIKKHLTNQILMQNSHVDYWMPFDGGIGLHDANWRKTFGGDIYLKNGSHGCVNIPHDAAGTIFETVSVGTTVIVQK